MNFFILVVVFISIGFYLILYICRDSFPKVYHPFRSNFKEIIFTFCDKLSGNEVIPYDESSKFSYQNLDVDLLGIDEAVETTDSNAQIGFLFEQFVVDNMIDWKSQFEFLDWRGDKYSKSKNYPNSNLMPDLRLKVRSKERKPFISIECKYRKAYNSDYFNSIKLDPEQVKRYNVMAKNDEKVYIALGVGGKPEQPADFFFIPLNQVNTKGIIGSKTLERNKVDINTLMKFNRNKNCTYFS